MANQSERLQYRVYQSPTDDEFFHQTISEPTSWENASTLLHFPVSPKVTTAVRTSSFESSILNVVICKKEGSPVSKDDANNNDNTTQAKGAGATPIGILCLNTGHALEFHHRAAKLGIVLKPEFQGHGYGPEAIEWALEWAFLSAGLHRVCLSVPGWNTRGIKVYENIGFVTEGRKREALWKDGKWWEYWDMAILEKEWAAKHGREIAV